MRKGEPLKGYLLYPVYAENRLVIPAGTALLGNVVKLNPDRSRRIHSRLRGDFTPFHVPVVQFDQLVLPDGSLQPMEELQRRNYSEARPEPICKQSNSSPYTLG